MKITLILFFCLVLPQKSQTIITDLTEGSSYTPTQWTDNSNNAQNTQTQCSESKLGPYLGYFSKNFKKTYNNLPPHYKVLISIDLFLSGFWPGGSNYVKILVDSQEIFSKTNIQSSNLALPYDYCKVNSLLLILLFNQGTFTIDQEIIHTQSSLQIQVQSSYICTLLSLGLKCEEVGLKNIIIQVYECHKSCLTCTGALSTQCLTCPYGVPINGSCQCQGYAHNFQCVTNCPTYYVPINGICEIECSLNCDKCQGNKCVNCSASYPYNINGQCYSTCPSWTQNCKDLKDFSTVGSYYIGKFFYNKNLTDIDYFSFNGSTLTGNRYTYYNNQLILGGFGVWGSGSNQIYFTQLQSHNKLRIYCQAYFIDGWSGQSLFIYVDNIQVYTQAVTSSAQSSNLMYKDSKDLIQNISITITHTSSSANIVFSTNLNSSPFIASLGITNLFILADYCDLNCQQCGIQFCSICSQGYNLVHNLCIVCNQTYNRNSDCSCIQGYYDDGSSQSCKQCSSQCSQCSNFNTCTQCSPHYKTLPLCQDCEDGYYQETGLCKQCENTCQTCSAQQICSTCTTGYGFKLDIDNLCHSCQSAHFIQAQNCYECSSQCQECQGISTNCLSCQANRINAPLCDCASGYYEDSYQNCSKCDQQCNQCVSQSNQCTLCNGNRQQTPNCDCPDGGTSRLQYNISYCSTCQLAVTIIQFSDDLTQISIDLGLSLYSFQNCINLLVNTNKLGNGVTCIIQSNYIIISLGQQPTIQVGDYIYLKNIKFLGCQTTAVIMNNQILAPKNIIQPLIRFNLQNYELLPCEQLRLDIIGTYLDGNRNLSIVGWSLLNLNKQDMLDNLNQQSQSFIITGQDYEINQSYQLKYSYTNFIQTLGETLFTFRIVNLRNPTLQILKPSKIFTYLINQIYTYIPILFCDQLKDTLSYNINFTLYNQTFNISLSRNTTQNKELFAIQDSVLANNQEYQIKSVFSFDNFTAEVNDKFIAQGEESQLSILGGSRQVGFRQQLQLQTQSSLIDDYEWGCYNIIELEPCDIPQNISEQDFSPYSFQPFQLLQFTVKQGNQMDSIVISTIESNTPQLEINMNQQYRTRLLNYYDELQFTINYPILINPDDLFYYVDILYNNNDTYFRVYYPTFAFRLWNYIDTNNTDITLQFSVFNPQYLVPSTSQVNLKLNIPPQNCKVTIINDTVSVSNCQDEDLPLQYIYVYYTSQEFYLQDNGQSHIYKGILIQNTTQDSQINFKIPQNDSVILIQVIDYLQGITNITINVNQSSTIQDHQAMLLESNTDSLYRNLITLIFEKQDQYYQQINQICLANLMTFYQVVQVKLLLYPHINISDIQLNNDYQNITTMIRLLTSQYQSLYIQQNNYYDQIGKLKLREHIYKSSQFLSLIYSLNLHYQSKSNRRLLYESHLLVNNLQTISDALESATLINGDQQQINTEQFNISVYKQTDLFYNNQQNNTSSIYTQSFQTILNNPYQNDSNFDYKQDMNTQLIIPTLKINNTDQQNQSINLTFETNSSIQQVCVNKVNGFWSINDCQTRQQDDKIICICQEISPTTIVQAISQLTSSVASLFTSDSIEQIKNMQIWYMAFTYIVIFFTIVYLISIYYGNKMDNIMLEEQLKLAAQVHPINSPLPIVDEEKIEDDSEKRVDKQNEIKFSNPDLQNINDDSKIEKPRQEFKRMTKRFYSNKITILRIKSTEDDDNQSKQNDITKLDIKEFKSITCETEQRSSKSITISAQIKKQVVNHLQAFWTYVKLWHDLISIYFRNDPRTSRIHRITIIYISILGQICIITVFGKILSLNTILALTILQDLFRFTFKAIISYLLNHDNQIMRTIGGITVLLSTGLFLFLIVASMAAYEDIYIANLWGLSYVCSFFINYFIYNTIGLAFYYIIIFKFYNIEIVKKIINFILDDQMIELFSEK